MANKRKNQHAVALGRKGGRKGGAARAAGMTREERSASARSAVMARWKKSGAPSESSPTSLLPPEPDSTTGRKARFQTLVAEWRRERGAMSSLTEMSMLPAYQKIIGMGADAVPLIIAQLRSEGAEPDQWFWALMAITDANPVRLEDQGNFVRMAQSWLMWAEKHGYAG
jgi:hypothetical protein